MNFLLEFLNIEILRKNLTTVLIMDKVKGHYEIIYRESFNPSVSKFKFANRTYLIKLDKCIFGNHNLPIIYYEKTNPSPIGFGDVNNKFDSELLTTVLENKEVQDFLATTNSTYLFLVIGLIVVVIAVIIFAVWNTNNLNNQINELLKKISSTVVIK